jgi:hypothetical protein
MWATRPLDQYMGAKKYKQSTSVIDLTFQAKGCHYPTAGISSDGMHLPKGSHDTKGLHFDSNQ